MKLLRIIIQAGGYIISFLGIGIMLIQNDTGEPPHHLINFTLGLVFAVGAILIFYLLKFRKL